MEGDNKSQEQTTSKKPKASHRNECHSYVTMQRTAVGNRENLPASTIASILKPSQEKPAAQAQQANQANQQKRGSNSSLNQTQNRIHKSVTQKDLSSSKKAQQTVV